MIMARATEILITEHGVDHVDLELRLSGAEGDAQGWGSGPAVQAGSARVDLAGHGASRRSPYDVPVTIKTRIGIDDDHQTYLDAGRIAERAGCAAIALHGRTARQYYGGDRRLAGDRPAEGRGLASRCWATATSGRRRTRWP